MDLSGIRKQFDTNPAHVSDRQLAELYKICGSPLCRHQQVIPPAESKEMATRISNLLHQRSQGNAGGMAYQPPEQRLPSDVNAQPPSPQRAINPFAN